MFKTFNEGVGSFSFSEQEVKDGCLRSLLKFIIDFNAQSKESFIEIHLTYDGTTIIVELAQNDYQGDGSFNGSFKYVKDDQVICNEMLMPDKTYELVPVGAENEFLKEWLLRHPDCCIIKDNKDNENNENNEKYEE